MISTRGACTPRNSHREQRHALVEQLILDRVIREIGVGFQIHLLEHAYPVGTHGFHAQVELVGDLRRTLSGGELAEYLELALGKRFVQLLFAGIVELGGNQVCRGLAQITPAP